MQYPTHNSAAAQAGAFTTQAALTQALRTNVVISTAQALTLAATYCKGAAQSINCHITNESGQIQFVEVARGGILKVHHTFGTPQ